jgi:Malonate decarboxylase, alpha subunit, transporter
MTNPLSSSSPMAQQTWEQESRSCTTRRDEKRRRMQLIQPWMKKPILSQERINEVLETLIVSGDRTVLEGDNQKQADFLSRSLVKVDPKKLHDLHLIISSISRPEHLTLFELSRRRQSLCLRHPPERDCSSDRRSCIARSVETFVTRIALRHDTVDRRRFLCVVWLVAGALSGLGRAFTEEAPKTGHRVVATARNSGHLVEVTGRFGDDFTVDGQIPGPHHKQQNQQQGKPQFRA